MAKSFTPAEWSRIESILDDVLELEPGARRAALDLLNRGATRIETELAGEPDVQADMMLLVGRITAISASTIAHSRSSSARWRFVPPARDATRTGRPRPWRSSPVCGYDRLQDEPYFKTDAHEASSLVATLGGQGPPARR